MLPKPEMRAPRASPPTTESRNGLPTELRSHNVGKVEALPNAQQLLQMHALFQQPPVHHPLSRPLVLSLRVWTRIHVAQPVDVQVVQTELRPHIVRKVLE